MELIWSAAPPGESSSFAGPWPRSQRLSHGLGHSAHLAIPCWRRKARRYRRHFWGHSPRLSFPGSVPLVYCHIRRVAPGQCSPSYWRCTTFRPCHRERPYRLRRKSLLSGTPPPHWRLSDAPHHPLLVCSERDGCAPALAECFLLSGPSPRWQVNLRSPLSRQPCDDRRTLPLNRQLLLSCGCQVLLIVCFRFMVSKALFGSSSPSDRPYIFAMKVYSFSSGLQIKIETIF